MSRAAVICARTWRRVKPGWSATGLRKHRIKRLGKSTISQAFFVKGKPLARRVVQGKASADDEERKNSLCYNESAVWQLHRKAKGGHSGMKDVNSLTHTSWNCKYHIVFAPKYRRKVFYGEKRREIGEILRTLCEWKKVRIVEAEVCPEHIHMLLEIPPKVAVSSFMGYLKGKSSLMIYEKFPELKYKYRNREFWCRGYYVDTAGKNAKKIQEYIKHQLEEDKAGGQLTMGDF